MNGAPPPPCMDSRRGGWQAPPPQRGGYNGVLDFEKSVICYQMKTVVDLEQSSAGARA